MSIVFSKNKKKRLRSSSNEANTSFVKNVASKVSGLLPATITKWFNSPSSSNTNGSAPVADTTDSSSEDEATESTIQPPSKRMRYSSPTLTNHDSIEITSVNMTETLDSCTQYSIVQSLPGRATFGRETNFSSTPLRPSNEEVLIEKQEREPNKFKLQHTPPTDTVNTKRTSLFCNESMPSSSSSLRTCNKNITVTEVKQPCYSASILGSPFYPGRTAYGGVTSSYINKPNIIQRKATVVNEISSDDNTISHSARRVMDLLEQYSSPLTEAKRIPHYKRNSRNDSFSNSLYNSSNTSKSSSYKTQELQVPTIASILRLKKRSRLMNTTSAARQIIASHSSSSDVSPYPSPHTQREQNKYDGNSNLTTKMKTKQYRSKRGDKTEVSSIVEVNFSSSALEIDHTKLPQFNFGIQNVSNSTSKANLCMSDNNTVSVANSSYKGNPTSTNHSKTDIISTDNVSNNNYKEMISKFSSPIKIVTNNSPRGSSSFKFTFVSPERSIDKVKVDESEDITIAPELDKDKAAESKTISKAWKCDTCWVSNKEDVDKCVCCSSKRPGLVVKTDKIGLLNKCTVCKIADSQSHVDKCKNCEKVPLKNNIINNTRLCETVDPLKWTCQDCWVKNDDNADKCVCCGSKKLKLKAEFSKDKTQSTKINKTTSEWKCDICWIKNADELDKCAACGGNKPKATIVSSDSGKSINQSQSTVESFKNITKFQTNQWECTSCLVRNDNDKSKCVCCETEKPGTVKESEKKMFNFGVNQNTSFKFGIDAKVQESIAKKPNNAFLNNNKKEEVSETNNNILDKTPTFAFGIPAKKSQDQTDDSKGKIEEPSKPSFTFGIPKPLNIPEMFVPIANTPNKLTETTSSSELKKENLQEVPKVDLPPYTSTDTSSVAKTTESPFSTKTVDNKLLLVSSNNETKNIGTLSNNQLQSQLTATTSESSSHATLKVSVPEIKMSGNLFSILQPNAASSNSFTAPSQSSAVVSSLFTNSIPATTSSEPIFQKKDTPNSTTDSLFTVGNKIGLSSSSTATPAPIFSFGSGPHSVQSQPEKPKFNFSFGPTNKTEIPTTFQTTFGVSTDKNASVVANKFNLPNPLENSSSGPLLGGNGPPANTLSGSTLPVGNAQSTSNVLGDANVLPLNPLLPNNSLSTANSSHNGTVVQTALPTGIFGTPVQKEIWSPNNNSNSNSNNLFVSNASSNNLAKAPTFTFGSSTPFNANATPTFGNNTQTSTIFGMPNQNSLFSNAAQNQPITNMFGSIPNNAPAATPNVFGSPNIGAPSTFGTSTATFDAPSLPPAPMPTFNFGSSQSTGVFGFGQQQPQQSAVYSFGATGGSAPQVQFNMGSHPAGRRVKKAVRRSSQR